MPNHEQQTSNSDQPTELTPEQKAFQELSTGAKTLSSVGFEGRHKAIVDSSFEKSRKKGEKQIGEKANERRNAAYLNRIGNLVEKYGDRAEKRLWQKSAENLIVNPEDIPESYWKQQEQILRDEGHGNQHLGNYERQALAEELQKHQADSLRSWSDYLGDKDSPYPMWFKVYAWDGMSKMGTFDKEKQRFSKRDKGTVAPYPKCNPAVLAKIFSAVERHYGHSDKDRFEEGDERDREMEELAKTNNFNALYSKILLTEKAIPKTPENPEDVHGEWVEYLPGQEKELANAAEGTPWCVADPGTGRSYLEHGEYGHNDYYDEYEDGEYDSPENKAKFILFHLYDPETNTLAENACASIRLGTDGNVAEISGLNDGQALEDSLVPTVEEKVKSLPGGERFLKAFADKKELIKLDRKMQNNEPLTKEEYEFLYELNRPIVTLDTYDDYDPRLDELLEEYGIASFLGVDGVNPTNLANRLIENGEARYVAYNLDKFLAAKADPTSLANRLIENSEARYVARNLDKFLAAKADIDPTNLANQLIENYKAESVADNLDKFLAAKADIDFTSLVNQLIKRGETESVADNLDKILAAKADPTNLANQLIENYSARYVVRNLDKFLAAGVSPDWLRQHGIEVPNNQ